MPLDQLLAALQREARATADRALEEARAEATAVTTASNEALARRREVSVAARIAEVRSAMELTLAETARATRGEELHARQRLLARVEAAVRAALPGVLTQPSYRASLPQRLTAALACVDGHDATIVRCPAPLVATLTPAIAACPGVTIQADDTTGTGYRLATADGTIEVDDTLESRLETSATSLAREALRRLEIST